MSEHRKEEGNKYYLKRLNSETKELEWIEINLESSTESEVKLSKHEVILNKPQHNYYFTQDNEVIEEPPMGIRWENLGHFE